MQRQLGFCKRGDQAEDAATYKRWVKFESPKRLKSPTGHLVRQKSPTFQVPTRLRGSGRRHWRRDREEAKRSMPIAEFDDTAYLPFASNATLDVGCIKRNY